MTSQTARPAGSAHHILVVEDDASVRALVEGVLLEEGFHVTAACHGVEALECVKDQEPHLILLDVSMPVMDGPTFAREYHRRSRRPAPIILLTAATGFEAAGRTDQVRVAGFLVKPFDVDHLVEIVTRILPAPAAPASASALAPVPAPAPAAQQADQPATPEIAPAPGPPRHSGTLGSHVPASAAPGDKAKRLEDERRRQLRRLASTVSALRESLGRNTDETRRLSALEATRKLTPEERTVMRTLRFDSERMRHEPQIAWQEFEHLRTGSTGDTDNTRN